jgi:predicted MFS family arabinose efflux permease
MSFLGALAMIYAVTTLSPILFCAVTFVVGLGTGSIMACVLINSQNAVRNEDRTVLSGLVQLGRYLGASVGVTILTGVLPAVGAMSDTVEFVGAFGVLAAMSLAGLINEFV